MATITHLYQQQNFSTIASELDVFLADARGRYDQRTNTRSANRCGHLAVAAILIELIDFTTLGEIETFLTKREELPSNSNRRIASLCQFFRCAKCQSYCPNNPVGLVEANCDVKEFPRPTLAGYFRGGT